MNVSADGTLQCFDKVVRHNDIITYDVNVGGCLYYTAGGEIYYIRRYDMTATGIVKCNDVIGVLNIYFIDYNGFVLTFRNRLEFHYANELIRTFEVPIKSDFRLFESHLLGQFCYINGGKVYTSDGDFVCQVPECKFIYEVVRMIHNRQYIINVSYITHNDTCVIQSYWTSNNTTYTLGVISTRNIVKVRCTDTMEVYYDNEAIIMCCCDTGYTIKSNKFTRNRPMDTWEFETNGHQWTILNGNEKYYYCNSFYCPIPLNSKLYKSGRQVIPYVPTKSARF